MYLPGAGSRYTRWMIYVVVLSSTPLFFLSFRTDRKAPKATITTKITSHIQIFKTFLLSVFFLPVAALYGVIPRMSTETSGKCEN